ncbi:MAG: hypothetical protein P8Y18_09335, partial [Candidatus Bathyarchaeota archaeon]
HLAQLYEQLSDIKEAAKYYELASKAYDIAAKKIPKLKDFYNNYSLYMMAWNQIQQAKQSHFREDYLQAMVQFNKAAIFLEKSQLWIYLSPNYYAWEQVEKGEDLSRKENQSEAIRSFLLAIQYFEKASEMLKTKNDSLESPEEQELRKRLLKSSNIRQRYCRARISLEEAKILDKKGNYNLSSTNYQSASLEFGQIIKEIGSEAEKKELKLMEILCLAWEKMALAEETTSSEFYLEAAKYFDQAKTFSVTKSRI